MSAEHRILHKSFRERNSKIQLTESHCRGMCRTSLWINFKLRARIAARPYVFWGLAGIFSHIIANFVLMPLAIFAFKTIVFLGELPRSELKDGRLICRKRSNHEETVSLECSDKLPVIMAIDGQSVRASRIDGQKCGHILNLYNCTEHSFMRQCLIESKKGEISSTDELLECWNILNILIWKALWSRPMLCFRRKRCLLPLWTSKSTTAFLSRTTQRLSATPLTPHVLQHLMLKTTSS